MVVMKEENGIEKMIIDDETDATKTNTPHCYKKPSFLHFSAATPLLGCLS